MFEEVKSADGNEHHQDKDFYRHNETIKIRRFLDSDNQNRGGKRDSDECHEIERTMRMRQRRRINPQSLQLSANASERFRVILVEDEIRPRLAGQRWGQLNAKVAKKADDVSTPTRSYRRCTKGVFEDQVPADDPGEYLAQGCIAIGIS